MANKEYVIWGIPPLGNEEVLLLSKKDGKHLTEQSDVDLGLALLEGAGCQNLRVQEIDFLTDPDFKSGVK